MTGEVLGPVRPIGRSSSFRINETARFVGFRYKIPLAPIGATGFYEPHPNNDSHRPFFHRLMSRYEPADLMGL